MAGEPQKTYTLKQFVNCKDADHMTYNRYSILERSLENESIIYAIDNIIYTYMGELKEKRQTVTVDDPLDRLKYMYKPKLLAYDLYGSTELFFVILALNGMCSLKEFTLEDGRFYALWPTDMISMLNSIYNAETKYLRLNRSDQNITESY